MGMFDSILAKVPGIGGDRIGAVIAGFAEDPAKLTGLVEDLDLGGLSEQVASWIGTGENRSVSAAQVKDALPPGRLDEIAANQGVTPDIAAMGISKMLPDLVNELTPDGVLPDADVLKDRLTALAAG